MKNLDFRSVIIGILSSALIFTLYGMRFQDENLGDITVKSITIEAGDNIAPFIIKNKKDKWSTVLGFNDMGDGSILTYSSKGSVLVTITGTEGGNGAITTYSSDGSELVTITGTEGGNGAITTYSSKGSELVTITVAEGGNGGLISTYASKGSKLVSISLDEGDNGAITTFSSKGSKLVSIGTSTNNGGLSLYNRHGKQVVMLRGDNDADGAISLSDRYGDIGWSVSGKK